MTARCRSLDLDPFSIEILRRSASGATRCSGKPSRVVGSTSGSVYGVARYAEVHAVAQRSRDVLLQPRRRLSDFAEEKPWRPQSLILEADPPAHTRTRAVLNRVLSPTVMKQIRASALSRPPKPGRRTCSPKAASMPSPDLAEAYPLVRCFPMRIGLEAGEGARICCPMRDWCSTRSGRRTSCARTRSNARRRIRPMSPNNASARTSRPAASAPASMRGSMPATSRRRGAVAGALAALAPASIPPVNGIGAAIYCLARFPDQLARLRSDPTLARNAFEEAVRFESPVQTFFRTTTRDVEIGGSRIGEGEKVLMFLAAANRDPRRWDNPDQLRRHAPDQRPCRLRLRHSHVRRPARRAAGRRGRC